MSDSTNTDVPERLSELTRDPFYRIIARHLNRPNKDLDVTDDVAELLITRASSAPDGEGEATCAHCKQPFTNKRADAVLCPPCFIAGHRGFVCGSYCVVTKESEAMAAQFYKDYAVNPELSPHGVHRPAPDASEVARRAAEKIAKETTSKQFAQAALHEDLPNSEICNDAVSAIASIIEAELGGKS